MHTLHRTFPATFSSKVASEELVFRVRRLGVKISVTIKDIARLLDVSHTTVSRALNDSPLISEATKKRIVDTAKMLNYVPNYSARSLVQNRSYNIGLFFATLGGSTSADFFYETVHGVAGVIDQCYNLVVNGLDQFDDFDWVDSRRFDGVILVSQSERDDQFVYYMQERKIPLVVLNRKIALESLVNILSDDRGGAKDAVNYLIENGHKEVALIGGVPGFQATSERREGYFEALMENGISIRGSLMEDGDFTMESGRRAMLKLLEVTTPPSSVFAMNDEMAIGAMAAIASSGFSIPEDFSIVGFDDSRFSAYFTPSLTTVRRSIGEVASRGAKALLDLVDGTTIAPGRVFVETKLIPRESVRHI